VVSAVVLVAGVAAIVARLHAANTSPTGHSRQVAAIPPVHFLVAVGSRSVAVSGRDFIVAFEVHNAGRTPLSVEFSNAPQISGFEHMASAALSMSLWTRLNSTDVDLPPDNVIDVPGLGSAFIAITGRVDCPAAGDSGHTVTASVDGHATDIDLPPLNGRTWSQQVATEACEPS